MKKYLSLDVLFVLLLAVVIVGSVLLGGKQPQAGASIVVGNEYTATSTAPQGGQMFGASTYPTGVSQVAKTGYGALAQVVITGANTGTLSFYNATTSNINLRVRTKASSTILLANFPASAAANTYVFDASFTDGLLIDVSGLMPTTTVMFR